MAPGPRGLYVLFRTPPAEEAWVHLLRLLPGVGRPVVCLVALKEALLETLHGLPPHPTAAEIETQSGKYFASVCCREVARWEWTQRF